MTFVSNPNTRQHTIGLEIKDVVAGSWQRSSPRCQFMPLPSQMLVWCVFNQLFNRILAPYVVNLDLNQVNYGIGQGKRTLLSKTNRHLTRSRSTHTPQSEVEERCLGQVSASCWCSWRYVKRSTITFHLSESGVRSSGQIWIVSSLDEFGKSACGDPGWGCVSTGRAISTYQL